MEYQSSVQMPGKAPGKTPGNFLNDLAVFLSGADRDIVNRLPETSENSYRKIGFANICISVITGLSAYQFLSYYENFELHKVFLASFGVTILVALVCRQLCWLLINVKKVPYIHLSVILIAVVICIGTSLLSMYGLTYNRTEYKLTEEYRKAVRDTISQNRKNDSIYIAQLKKKIDSARTKLNIDDPLTVDELDTLVKQIKALEAKLQKLSTQILPTKPYSNPKQRAFLVEREKRFDSDLGNIKKDIYDAERRQKKDPKNEKTERELKSLEKKKKSLSDSLAYYQKEKTKSDSLFPVYQFYSSKYSDVRKKLEDRKQDTMLLRDNLNSKQRLALGSYQNLTDSLTPLIVLKEKNMVEKDSMIAGASLLPLPPMDPDEKVDHYIGQAFRTLPGISFFVLSNLVMLGFWIMIFRGVKKGEDSFYYEMLAEKERLSKDSLEKQREKISLDYKLQTNIRQSVTLAKELSKTELSEKPSVADFLKNVEDETSPKSLRAAAEFEQSRGNFGLALEYVDRAIELDPNIPETWLLKTTLFGKMGKVKEEEMARQRYATLLGKINFEKNLQRKIILREIEFNNLPFYGSFIWPLRSSINILLGKNGYGKSHMMAIVLAQMQEDAFTLTELSRIALSSKTMPSFIRIRMQYNDAETESEIARLKLTISELEKKKSETEALQNTEMRFVDKKTPELAINREHEMDQFSAEINRLYDTIEYLKGRSLFDRSGTIKSIFGKIPVLAIPDSRSINKSSNYTQSVIEDEAKKILEFGAYHFIRQAPYGQVIQNFLNSLAIIYFERLTFEDEIFRLINRVFKKLTGSEFRWQEIKRSQDGSGYEIKVSSEGTTEPLPIQKVSQGTLSVLSMMGVIFHYLDLRYKHTVLRHEIVKQNAIIVIDEIDAHLHPSWQQKIIGILRSEFPNVQFIISAHSPLIVAGCKEGEVSVMRKTSAGFAIETIQSHLIGMPIADLFQMIFEIEEKDETYLQLSALLPFKGMILKEIETLNSKKSLTEKERSRLSELEEQAANFSYFESYQAIKNSKEEKEILKLKYTELKLEYDRITEELNQMKESFKS